MYAPDVWEETETEKAYAELRKRADGLGFACVGEALDKLEEMLDPRYPIQSRHAIIADIL